MMFHSKVNGDVVIMRMTNGSLDVQQGYMAASRWRRIAVAASCVIAG